MKSLLILSALINLGFSNPDWATNPPTLDINAPIYLAHVFYPPTMLFIAFTEHTSPTEKKVDWCLSGLDVTASLSAGARTPPFEIEGIDGLRIHEYFADKASISRHHERFAECFISPESGDLGVCKGDKELGQKFGGAATRVWSCWVIKDQEYSKRVVYAPRENEQEDWLVPATLTGSQPVEETGKCRPMYASSSLSAFTAGITASS